MITGMEWMTCPNLAAPAQVMQHVVNVESGDNPYAIGVVGNQLARQPQNLGEALATVQMLESGGYNFSVGIAQVNRANLSRYGLDSYAKAFDPCLNISAGSRILKECYTNAGGDWGKAFSCYYSGNFVTGFHDGYVQKIYDSINRSAKISRDESSARAAIPLQQIGAPIAARGAGSTPLITNGSGAYRIAMRSMALDTATAPATVPVVATLGSTQTAQAEPTTTPGSTAAALTTATGNAATAEIFVPRVHGAGNPPQKAAPAGTRHVQTAAATSPTAPAIDQAALHQGGPDAAFVF